jgi:hypothetical protein
MISQREAAKQLGVTYQHLNAVLKKEVSTLPKTGITHRTGNEHTYGRVPS